MSVCVMLQVKLVDGRLVLDEMDPSVSVTLSPTVAVSCPPCSMTVRLVNPVGLTVSTCSLTFTADHPLSGQTVDVRAVPTAGSNSRTTRLQFHGPVDTHVTGSGWDLYTIAPLPVSSLSSVEVLFERILTIILLSILLKKPILPATVEFVIVTYIRPIGLVISFYQSLMIT